ncbi:MAG: hypothetical protein OXU79_11025 [Gemmatimonadota bacterium]|nr:hypothetical protein [Gemmatimonadota bacterium]
MRVEIKDKRHLKDISPGALSAFARAAGWKRVDNYGDSSDVYTADGLPEVILPRTDQLGDYANVVSRLIEIYADVSGTDELAVYHDLIASDRDVIRVRAVDDGDGAASASDRIDLARGARDLVLAAACSLHDPRSVYRAAADKASRNFVRKLRTGQTDQQSFVATLLTPVVSPPVQQSFIHNTEHTEGPIERRMTRRLVSALRAARRALEGIMGGNANAFHLAVEDGVSANFCEALVRLVEPYESMDVSLTWARTRPMNPSREIVHFANSDVPILREAARLFRESGPKPDVLLFGFVQRRTGRPETADAIVTLRAHFEGQIQPVEAVLTRSDYERAMRAHQYKASVIIAGDLVGNGKRHRLLNPRIVAVIPQQDVQEEGE